MIGIDQEFQIPPGSDSFQVNNSVRHLPSQGKLLSISPHMHYRGKAFQLFAKNQAGPRQLLDVPNYDFNWQHSYQLSNPIDLATIDRLDFTVTFDNSDANPFNPDPRRTVTWGDQTWEEMAVAFFDVATPRQTTDAEPRTRAKDPLADSRRQEKIKRFVDDFFERFDTNGDGKIFRDELPNSLKHFGFWRFNVARDGVSDDFLDREEIEMAASLRIRH